MIVFGLFEIVGPATLRQRAARLAAADLTVSEAPGRAERERAGGAERPPPVARELIAVADGLSDLIGTRAPTDAEQAATALAWLNNRLDGLLSLCEIARITDDGELDFMRHEVVGDRPAPSDDLVDHIADTVRPGYRWRHDLLRPQQVVAYVPAD